MICPNCKTTFEKESKFCPECGYSFADKRAKPNNDKRLYIILSMVFVMFLLWLYTPFKQQQSINTSNTSTNLNKQSSTNATTKKTPPLSESVNLNSPFNVENQSEITIKNIEFVYDVVPLHKKSLYSHYQAEAGKVYCVINTTVKNLSKEKITADKIADVSVLYDAGEYKYRCMSIIEAHGDLEGAHYSSIDPLNPEQMKYIVEMPDEAQSNNNPIKIQFSINGKLFTYNYR